jgi:hypothetical protein
MSEVVVFSSTSVPINVENVDHTEPLQFDSNLRPQIWGGDGLECHLGKQHPEHSPPGEARGLSALPQHLSRVSDGSSRGKSREQLRSQSHNELSGGTATGDATFRLFDWNRPDAAGPPRPLQVDRGRQAIRWQQGPIDPVAPNPLDLGSSGVLGTALLKERGGRLERYFVERPWISPLVGEMMVWMVLEGNLDLLDSTCGNRRELVRGSTILIPEAAGDLIWLLQSPDSRRTLICICQRGCGTGPHQLPDLLGGKDQCRPTL